MKKTLFVFNAESPFQRALARGIRIGFFSLISIVITQLLPFIPESYIAVITMILAILDKYIRDSLNPNN